MKSIQIRGNCQCCGREQAVVNGRMSKHGYTVNHGWFNGVCSGRNYAPLQTNRDRANSIIEQIRKEVPELLAQAELVKAGKSNPVSIQREVLVINARREKIEVAFADATAREQKHALHAIEWSLRLRAKAGEDFANMLEEVANKVHGTALTEVAKKEAPAFIMPSDKKIDNDMTYTCTSVDGARVYYKLQKGDKVFKGWMGSQSWRKMASV